MTFNGVSGILALFPPSGSGQSSAPGWMQMFPIVLMVIVFYFVLIRPQQKRAKDHESLLKTLKAGDRVTTSSGLIGVVISVKEKSVSLRCADSKLEVVKSSVTEVTRGETSES
jgi:preprotein translocase subunit YajC